MIESLENSQETLSNCHSSLNWPNSNIPPPVLWQDLTDFLV